MRNALDWAMTIVLVKRFMKSSRLCEVQEFVGLKARWRSFAERSGGKARIHCRPIERDVDPELLSRLTEAQRERGKSFATVSRRVEWAEARRAELAVRDSLAGGAICVSVAHSADVVIAVGFTGLRGGVGVDFESIARETHPELKKKVEHPSERHFSLSALELWVIKEASFKSDPNNAGLYISQYIVKSYDPVSGEGEVVREAFRCRFLLIELPKWIVAFAISDFIS